MLQTLPGAVRRGFGPEYIGLANDIEATAQQIERPAMANR